ncbi:MAG: phosphopantothenoylcysteine decarboxylase [Candidatus Omnitrophota bacterium]
MSDLFGKKILLTSGPTCAPLDAVRYIANRSTGRLGSAIAYELHRRGAELIHLAGENSFTSQQLHPGEDLSRIRVERFLMVEDLKDKLRRHLLEDSLDAVLMAAAVLDYVPADPLPGKKSSQDGEWIIRLKRGEKLIEHIRVWAPHVFLVGFKLEADITLEELSARAGDLMDRSGAALVLANRLEEIGNENHVGYIIERIAGSTDCVISPPLRAREEIAARLADRLSEGL